MIETYKISILREISLSLACKRDCSRDPVHARFTADSFNFNIINNVEGIFLSPVCKVINSQNLTIVSVETYLIVNFLEKPQLKINIFLEGNHGYLNHS